MINLDKEQAEFLHLLDENHNEQIYQSYLENHTRFIPHEFVQNHGIGLSLVLRKLPFGADYISDFFISLKARSIGTQFLSKLRNHNRSFSKAIPTNHIRILLQLSIRSNNGELGFS